MRPDYRTYFIALAQTVISFLNASDRQICPKVVENDIANRVCLKSKINEI